MRRSQSMLAIGALVAVLWPTAASASLPLHPVTVDEMSRALFARCFGETDTRFSSQSPLRLAFTDSALSGQAFVVRFTRDDAPLVAPSSAMQLLAARYIATPQLPAQPSFTGRLATVAPSDTAAPIALYRAPEPAPTQGPAMRRFDLANGSNLVSFSPVMLPSQSFDARASGLDANPLVPNAHGGVVVPVRVGRVRFQTHAEAAQAQSAALSLDDRALGAGATFDVRAGDRRVGLDLSSNYEHLTLDAPRFNASNFAGTSTIGLAGETLPVFVPAYADVSKHTLSAGLAVPLSRRLTASVRYDTQHLLGGYGVPGLNNLDARNDIYDARVTFQLPRSASALSLSAKQYHYTDNLSPSSFTQTSANLDFTVKF